MKGLNVDKRKALTPIFWHDSGYAMMTKKELSFGISDVLLVHQYLQEAQLYVMGILH